jgi:hypothetical protein
LYVHSLQKPRSSFSRKHAHASRLKAGLSTLVALIDTGIDANHRELKQTISPSGWNFITGDNNIADDNGHGTQVAGIIAQSTISNFQSPISILPLKALDQSGNGTIGSSPSTTARRRPAGRRRHKPARSALTGMGAWCRKTRPKAGS